MVDAPAPDVTERRRFVDNLPWFVNGSLAASERDWMHALAQRSPWAARVLAAENALQRSVVTPEPADPELGLQALLGRIRAERPARAAAAPANPWPGLFGWLTAPRLAGALAGLVVAQAGVIGWIASHPQADADTTRSTPVTELRTLRVTFAADASEAQLRAALQAAGARVIGGPTQLGEYWLASDIRSLAEMTASLQASGLTRSIDIDIAGPHGR